MTTFIWIRNIDIDGSLDQGDEGDKDGEAENGQTFSVILCDVVEVYVGVFLLTNQ